MTTPDPGPDEWNEDDYLAAILSNRSTGSIMMVRQGVCDFHKGRSNILLSPMMVHALATKKGLRACYVCGEVF